jgi:flagellar assembly protein FliH
MPSLSSVIKAQQTTVNGSERHLPKRLPVNGASTVVGESTATAGLQTDLSRPLAQQAPDIIADAEQRAAEILAAAQREREEILKQAEMNALAMGEQAQKEGYQAGYLEGLTVGRRESDELRCQALAELSDAQKLRAEMLKQVEPKVVALALSVAEKMIGEQLAVAPEFILTSVKEGLAQISETGEILVRLHPEDIPVCKTYHSDLQSGLREHSTLSFIPDASLEKGSCRIETNGAVVECLIGERLAELRKMLAEAARDV